VFIVETGKPEQIERIVPKTLIIIPKFFTKKRKSHF
jgi:hypothetical protein